MASRTPNRHHLLPLLIPAASANNHLNLPPPPSFAAINRHQPPRKHRSTLRIPLSPKTRTFAGKKAANLGPECTQSLANRDRQMNPLLFPVRLRTGIRKPLRPNPVLLRRSETDLPIFKKFLKKIKGSPTDTVVQYVVLRRDLIDTWPLGSLVTQGCHASVAAIWAHKDDSHTLFYCSPSNLDSMHKVTLEVKGEAQLVNLSDKLKAGGIAHKLWIEQPENFPTWFFKIIFVFFKNYATLENATPGGDDRLCNLV